MSIIHEALKKAQSDLEKQGNSDPKNTDITKLYEELHQPFTQKDTDSSAQKKSPPPLPPSPKSTMAVTPSAQKTVPSDKPSPSSRAHDFTQEMTQHLRTQSEKISPKKSWFKLILTLVCVFLIGTGILFGVFLYLVNESSNVSPSVIQPTFSKTKSIPVPTEENPLILSGTMMMGDKRVALINNGIYEVGELVEGKKITAITLEKVELLDGENVITLKAK